MKELKSKLIRIHAGNTIMKSQSSCNRVYLLVVNKIDYRQHPQQGVLGRTGQGIFTFLRHDARGDVGRHYSTLRSRGDKRPSSNVTVDLHWSFIALRMSDCSTVPGSDTYAVAEGFGSRRRCPWHYFIKRKHTPRTME